MKHLRVVTSVFWCDASNKNVIRALSKNSDAEELMAVVWASQVSQEIVWKYHVKLAFSECGSGRNRVSSLDAVIETGTGKSAP